MLASTWLPLFSFWRYRFKFPVLFCTFFCGLEAQSQVAASRVEKQNSTPTPKWLPLPTPPAGSVRSQTQTHDGRVFAGTTGGIYRSTDKGESWVLLGVENTIVDSLLATKNDTLLAGTYREGLLRSTDGGLSWQHVGFDRNVYLYGIAQDTDGTIYVSATLGIKDEPQGYSVLAMMAKLGNRQV